MSWNQGNLVRFSLQWRDTRWPGNTFRNILHFRIRTGEAPAGAGPDIMDTFISSWMTRILGQMPATSYISHLKISNLTNLAEPEDEVSLAPTSAAGSISVSTDDVPQACAVIVRHTYQRGRTGIGRYFFGPLPARFADTGFVIIDPGGIGDLTDVVDALGDEMSYTGGVIFRPVVVAANASTAASNNDVRRNLVAPQVCYLKSRRLGKGE